MKAQNIDLHIHNMDKETCITVTDGEHFFKVYNSTHIEPMLESFCKLTGTDMTKFTATESKDQDMRGAVEILRNGDLKIIRDGEVTPLKLMMIRNDADGLLVVLENKSP